MFFLFSSFYGRIEKSIGCLPRFYYHNKPYIALTESGQRSTHHEAPAYSYNWILGSDRVEQVESKSGKLRNCTGISRLSKQSLFRKFLNIRSKFPNLTGKVNKVVYADEKFMAEDYQVWLYMIYSSNENIIYICVFVWFYVDTECKERMYWRFQQFEIGQLEVRAKTSCYWSRNRSKRRGIK